MIPVGYMYKVVSGKPDWLKASQIEDIYSVSSCVSEDFCDWVNYWKHNGYWFFDSPSLIHEIANENSIDLDNLTLFYYEMYEKQWDYDDNWTDFSPEEYFSTNVVVPASKVSLGFDIVTYTNNTSAECSPLSCNHMAEEIETNEHCLLETFKSAVDLIEQQKLSQCEPGPYRIVEVFRCEQT
ncbi:hypothetical protein ACWO25_004523 [Vibrio parahaemolyticus]|nr:hypothetical protein [Vibrio parahaemolyticus]EIT7131857.1 hypothetical protein [Vibrio parahaemolyticus]